jgi:hypothetical protein
MPHALRAQKDIPDDAVSLVAGQHEGGLPERVRPGQAGPTGDGEQLAEAPAGPGWFDEPERRSVQQGIGVAACLSTVDTAGYAPVVVRLVVAAGVVKASRARIAHTVRAMPNIPRLPSPLLSSMWTSPATIGLIDGQPQPAIPSPTTPGLPSC